MAALAATFPTARSLAARTVHIKISPSPRTFRESREVLLELEEKCGEVAMFRSLKYNATAPVQNAALAIFQTEAAAQKALDQSPFTYGVIIEPIQSIKAYVGPPGGPLIVDPPRQYSHASPVSEIKEDQDQEPKPTSEPEAPKREEKWFHLDVSPSDFKHHLYLKSENTNPLYGPYKPVRHDKSFIAGALLDSVLPSLWAKGLRDWETDSVRKEGSVDYEERTEKDGDGEWKQAMVNRGASWHVRQRQARKGARDGPEVMKGLRNLRKLREEWEKGAGTEPEQSG